MRYETPPTYGAPAWFPVVGRFVVIDHETTPQARDRNINAVHSKAAGQEARSWPPGLAGVRQCRTAHPRRLSSPARATPACPPDPAQSNGCQTVYCHRRVERLASPRSRPVSQRQVADLGWLTLSGTALRGCVRWPVSGFETFSRSVRAVVACAESLYGRQLRGDRRVLDWV